MNHPMIERTLNAGYPYSPRRDAVGTDGLGNEVFPNEEILELDDEFYLVEELSSDAKEILENHGAIYKMAK